MFAEYGHENKRKEMKLLNVRVHGINNNARQKIKPHTAGETRKRPSTI